MYWYLNCFLAILRRLPSFHSIYQLFNLQLDMGFFSFYCKIYEEATYSFVYILSFISHCTYSVFQGPSWTWSYGSWISNCMCHQCLSPLKLWVHSEVYSIQHYVTKFVSDDLRHVGGFLRVLRFSPPIKLTTMA